MAQGSHLEQQSAADVFMIRPAGFASNAQTTESNRFQARVQLAQTDQDAVQATALAEFNDLTAALRTAGVLVHVFEDTQSPHTPDAIFPNNWVSSHADGTVVLYPMLAPNRREERRMDVLETLGAQAGFRIRRVLDLSHYEERGKYLEGTGSLVLDREHHIAYACISPRTDLDVLGDFSHQLDYDLVTFEAQDASGCAIYHTNVLMSVGEKFAAVCTEVIREDERAGVLDALRSTQHAVIELSAAQMGAFAGNMLEVRNCRAGKLVAMSTRARDALTPEQRELLESTSGPIVAAAIPTIERLGGGSVRCMLAEVYLPKKAR
jgi:hypothetical protein